MSKLTMRFLVISTIVLMLSACKSYHIPDAVKSNHIASGFSNLYFSDPLKDYIYKANITVYGNQLGGILIVKKINDSTHRIVMTTTFGNTLFDFEMIGDDFKVNYVMDDLNKKIILKTLRNDFKLLLKAKHDIRETQETNTQYIYQSKEGRRYNYFIEDKISQQFISIVSSSKTKAKVKFEFKPKSTTFAENIVIQHLNIQLKIDLYEMEN